MAGLDADDEDGEDDGNENEEQEAEPQIKEEPTDTGPTSYQELANGVLLLLGPATVTTSNGQSNIPTEFTATTDQISAGNHSKQVAETPA